jgi:hypothetical protein
LENRNFNVGKCFQNFENDKYLGKMSLQFFEIEKQSVDCQKGKLKRDFDH